MRRISVRTPLQARSRETLARFMAAADDLFARKGIAETTVQEIVTAAGASIGSFYARFADKEAFVVAFFARYYEHGTARVAAGFAGAAWKERGARAVVEAWIAVRMRYYQERTALMRAVLMHRRAHDKPEFRKLAADYSADLRGRFERLLLARRREIGHPNPERAVLHTLLMIEAMLKDIVLFRDRRSPALATSDDELRQELTRASLAYLEIER